MAVAKSYTNFEFLGDPFTENGKEYIMVRNPKTGTERKVRWYTGAEAEKITGVKEAPTKNKYYRPLKDVLGFEKGYIWLCAGCSYDQKEEVKVAGARYNANWGWFFPSEVELPAGDPPEGVHYEKLLYEQVFVDEETLRSADEIHALVDSMIYEESPSQWIGEIGDKIIVEVVITNISHFDGAYGQTTAYTMVDDDKNTFVWFTSTKKDWEVWDRVCLSGTVKDHKSYKNEKQTILTRCREG